LFTGLPKLADKAFVVGFLVPVLAAFAAVLALFQEVPAVSTLTRNLAAADDLAKLTATGAAVFIAALILLLINRPIYRALEGYVGPLSMRPFKRQALADWNTLETKRKGLRTAYDRAATDDEKQAANLALRALVRDFRKRYPRDEHLVLPTRFGNANRAFETYSANAFGIEAILVWPRLSAILPKALQDGLTDIRAQVNCFANLTVLLEGAVALRLLVWAIQGVYLAVFQVKPPPGVVTPMQVATAIDLVVLIAALGGVAYEMAVARAYALGDQVRVAFDLHLLRLPGRLGYRLQTALAARGEFWAALEDAWDFQNAVEGYKASPPPDGPDAGGASSAGDDDSD
jgi:hypothetical protein